MALINLNDYSTKAVLRQFNLTPQRRIGRGATCVVYDDGPGEVFKLTVDAVQRESVRDYLGGVHFPKMVKDIGHVGTQGRGKRELYLFKAERLRPTRDADAATRKLARQVLATVDEFWADPDATRALHARGSLAQTRSACASVVLDRLVDCKRLPESIRDAFQDIQRMVWDYHDLVIDFRGANLMVRGTDELVLNDVIANGELLFPN
jgi:hypothetical protein